MLEVKNLTAGYGEIIAVRDFSFTVNAGHTLSIMGANGAGKSSTLMALMGLTQLKSGSILINGEDITRASVESRVSRGIAIVPEGRRIFSDLTVRENLVVGGHVIDKKTMAKGIERVYSYFPRLGERSRQLAGSLSGGEQQMLAMGRALISEPKLLIIDELSLGLMPTVISECYGVIERLLLDDVAVILVEQNAERALKIADNVCILEAGNLIWSGTAKSAKNSSWLTDSLIGIH